jgi:hypothetical protein
MDSVCAALTSFGKRKGPIERSPGLGSARMAWRRRQEKMEGRGKEGFVLFVEEVCSGTTPSPKLNQTELVRLIGPSKPISKPISKYQYSTYKYIVFLNLCLI